MLRKSLHIIAWISAGFVIFGFLGSISRAADSFSLLRPVFAALAVIGFLTARHWIVKTGFVLVCATAAITIALPFAPQSPGTDIRIYSKNMWFRNTQTEALAADILQANVDAVFLQEISDNNVATLELIKQTFPHQHLCPFSRWSGIAVASRTPFIAEPKCTDYRSLAAVQISHEGAPVWLVSAHIPWPWPTDTAQSEEQAYALLEALDGNIVIAGDFNIFAWSHRVQSLARVTQNKLAGPTQTTLRIKRLPLAIDHAMAPGGGRLETRGLFGADHRGIVADLSLSRD